MNFNLLGRYEGLPSSNIECTCQDKDGFMWIGTDNGLVRFDGSSMLILQHDIHDTNSLSDNSIRTIVRGPGSALWIGTINGVSILDPGTLKTKRISLKTPFYRSDYVMCMLFENDDLVWIGTQNGVFRYETPTKKLTHYLGSAKSNIVSRESKFNAITFIIRDPRDKNHLLLGTNGGLLLFDKVSGKIIKDYKHIIPPVNMSHYGAYTGFLDDKNRVWTHGWSSGINVFDLATEKWTDYLFNKKANAVSEILRKNNDELWVSSLDSGLILVNLRNLTYSTFQRFSTGGRSRLSDYVPFLSRDRDGNLWAVSPEGIQFEDKRYHSFHQKDIPLPHDWIGAFLRDPVSGRLYFGPYDGDGIYWCDEKTGKWNSVSAEEVLKNHTFSVNTMFCDSHQRFWIGTRNSLYLLDRDRNRLVLFRTPDGKPLDLKDNVIYEIFEDHAGNLWIGTRFEGVVRIDSSLRQVTYFRRSESDTTGMTLGPYIRGICEDNSGRIWIGNFNGFSTFDPRTSRLSAEIIDQAQRKGILKRMVYSIRKDTLGRMWLSCDRQGMLRVTETSPGNFDFKLFTTQHGLYDQEILYFSEDPWSNYWIVNNGIVCLNPYEETFRVFNVFNGLHEQVNGDVKIYVDREGDIFVGSGIGYETINKNVILENRGFFNLVLSGIEVNGKGFRPGGAGSNQERISFNADETNLTFYYTAVNFTFPNQIRYQFMLEGYDRGWSNQTASREARYTNLSPGKYAFHVRSLVGGNPFGSERVIRFSIGQYFWKTWWFILLCILALQVLLYLLFAYRRNQLIRLQKLRTRIATDLHDDVSSTLSSISILSSLVSGKVSDPQTSEMVGEISTSSRSMLEQMDDIIWAVNPKNDRFQDFGLRIREFAIPLFESAGIRFSFDYPESLSGVRIPMDVRRNLYLIAKEAINNLVKYSDCSQAEVRISYDHSRISMLIKDNGIGFDPNAITSRNGLRNMSVRAKKINAEFRIDSRKGAGTSIMVEMKIR